MEAGSARSAGRCFRCRGSRLPRSGGPPIRDAVGGSRWLVDRTLLSSWGRVSDQFGRRPIESGAPTTGWDRTDLLSVAAESPRPRHRCRSDLADHPEVLLIARV